MRTLSRHWMYEFQVVNRDDDDYEDEDEDEDEDEHDDDDDDDDDGGDDDDDGDDDGVYLLLQVHGNRLETLPESIKYLSKLKRLWVSDNQLEVRTFFVEL